MLDLLVRTTISAPLYQSLTLLGFLQLSPVHSGFMEGLFKPLHAIREINALILRESR
jgi:hypothetical protein